MSHRLEPLLRPRSVAVVGASLREDSMGAVIHDRAPGGGIYASYLAYMQHAHAESGKPVALVSAQEGVLHKTEQQGVLVNIGGEASLREQYAELASRLGHEVLVASMIAGGVELFFGVRRDPQFGPIVLLGFGGTLAEVAGDVTFAVPPFDAAHARRCLDRLELRPLLDGVRGAPAANMDALCQAAARFSAMVAGLADAIDEIDVNPVIALPDRVVAVDALVVGSDRRKRQ